MYIHVYRRSGNFRVKKVCMINFRVKKFSYEGPLTALALIVHANFRKINFYILQQKFPDLRCMYVVIPSLIITVSGWAAD